MKKSPGGVAGLLYGSEPPRQRSRQVSGQVSGQAFPDLGPLELSIEEIGCMDPDTWPGLAVYLEESGEEREERPWVIARDGMVIGRARGYREAISLMRRARKSREEPLILRRAGGNISRQPNWVH